MEISEKVKDSFWKRVKRAGDYKCWLWAGSKQKNGYGDMNVGNKKIMSVHRVSYQINIGDIPPNMLVMHICDNRLCVNPNHLRLGSHKDNSHDMLWKGRRRKVNRKDVAKKPRVESERNKAIRLARESGKTYQEIGLDFNISRERVRQILSKQHP